MIKSVHTRIGTAYSPRDFSITRSNKTGARVCITNTLPGKTRLHKINHQNSLNYIEQAKLVSVCTSRELGRPYGVAADAHGADRMITSPHAPFPERFSNVMLRTAVSDG